MPEITGLVRSRSLPFMAKKNPATCVAGCGRGDVMLGLPEGVSAEALLVMSVATPTGDAMQALKVIV